LLKKGLWKLMRVDIYKWRSLKYNINSKMCNKCDSLFV
jgi:hypothetical protein